SRKHVHVSDHRNRRASAGYCDRAVRRRAPSDVREWVPVPSRHAAGAGLVLGVCPDRRDDAISDMAALGRGTLPREESTRIYRIPETGPPSSCAIRVVVESVALRCATTPKVPADALARAVDPCREPAYREDVGSP